MLEDTGVSAEFAFIYVTDSLEHDYYKWRVLSTVYGDDPDHYRSDPFMLASDGVVYYPPEHYELPE